jgi:hypothetical protein
MEKGLGGMSRSGGDTNWNVYIVPDFDPTKIHSLERGKLILYNDAFEEIATLRPTDKVQIIDAQKRFVFICKNTNRKTHWFNKH